MSIPCFSSIWHIHLSLMYIWQKLKQVICFRLLLLIMMSFCRPHHLLHRQIVIFAPCLSQLEFCNEAGCRSGRRSALASTARHGGLWSRWWRLWSDDVMIVLQMMIMVVVVVVIVIMVWLFITVVMMILVIYILWSVWVFITKNHHFLSARAERRRRKARRPLGLAGRYGLMIMMVVMSMMVVMIMVSRW